MAEKINIHTSSMTSEQRKLLINTLSFTNTFEELAFLTDPELHEKWLIDCNYDNPYEYKEKKN